MPRYSVLLKIPGGGTAIVHTSKPARACICEYKLSVSLCDYIVRQHATTGKAVTCDAPLCTDCRTHIEPDTDYCPAHARREHGDY